MDEQYEERYKALIEKLHEDSMAESIGCIYKIYEKFNKMHFVSWVKNHPSEWGAICFLGKESVTPQLAEDVMKKLKESNIIELQMVWAFKCCEVLDIYGNLDL